MGARLAVAPEGHLGLSGQGVRDVTRVAAGDPGLYGQIVAGNTKCFKAVLTAIQPHLSASLKR